MKFFAILNGSAQRGLLEKFLKEDIRLCIWTNDFVNSAEITRHDKPNHLINHEKRKFYEPDDEDMVAEEEGEGVEETDTEK